MKMIFRSLILLLILQVNPGNIKSQERNQLIDRIKAQLFFYRTQNVNEDIVIQTDKSLYRLNETIWVNGFVADALTNMPSAKSKELVVQLRDKNEKVIISENIPLNAGLASGSLSIPSGKRSDRYFLTARTPEMADESINRTVTRDIYICSPEFFLLHPSAIRSII